MTLAPLPDLMLEPLVRAALLEDLGRAGDITTNALAPAHLVWKAALVTRQKGVVAGLDCARLAFRALDPSARFDVMVPDGTEAEEKTLLAVVHGNARALLTAERVALNFVGHLSGIATATRALVEAARPHKARICCTRKTLPGLRVVEKYAVRAGGGSNHRFGLDDAMQIKDNHVALAGGVRPAVERVRAAVGHMVKIELEVDTLEQVEEALGLCVDSLLLDNMPPPVMAEAVKLVAGRFITVASGNVRLATVPAIAATGVDLISSGALTHSATALDVGLDDEG